MPSTHEQSLSDTYEANDDFFDPVGARLVDLTDLRPGDRVLDLGCGRGAVLFAAVAAVGPDGYTVGVDLSPAVVRHTAAQAARVGLRNVSVRVDDAEDLGFPDRSFEAVLASFTLHLTPDPAAALAGAHRVLVPGGHFGLTTFGGDTGPAWQQAVQTLRGYAEPSLGGARGRRPHPTPADELSRDPEAALIRAGFTAVRTVEETTATAYPGPDAWWQSLRPLLEAIPPDHREEAREAAYALIAPLAHHGRLIRYTTARRD
ncbi:class I SAM-dependent methyltransferase [Peterkaempfera bronchialis]|nr:class I SAM-dependent methyltransferase [Peterkaempfera bronchialis]